MLITISGAHKSGKSTLASEVAKHLASKTCRIVHLLPSYSHSLLEHFEFLGVHCYDDINKLGLRSVFQTLIVAKLFDRAKQIIDLHLYNKDTVVITDRWFADAFSYGALELSSEVKEGWIVSLREMNIAVNKAFENFKIKQHSFVIEYQEFGVVEEKKSRATLDPVETTKALLEWCHSTETKIKLITQKRIDKRIAAILVEAGFPTKEQHD